MRWMIVQVKSTFITCGIYYGVFLRREFSPDHCPLFRVVSGYFGNLAKKTYDYDLYNI